MLSVAFIVATALARWVKSASVAVALSRIACAKASQSGICASVTPSCDCNVRIRWSTAAWVVAEGAELDGGQPPALQALSGLPWGGAVLPTARARSRAPARPPEEHRVQGTTCT